MNSSNQMLLIDDDEIRAALKPERPDRIEFAKRVHQKVNAGAAVDLHRGESAHDQGWLRVAASVLPVPLLGGQATGVSPVLNFAAMSVGKKAIVTLAFPFLTFLMVGLTVLGMMRIRWSQQDHDSSTASSPADVQAAQAAIHQWWKRYGAIAVLVFSAALIAPFFDWTLPVITLLVLSGFAAVSLVCTLAKQGLAERSVVGGICVAGLGLIGSVSQMLGLTATSQLLDPLLVTGVLFGGAFLIGSTFVPMKLDPSDETPSGRRPVLRVFSMLLACLILGVTTQSLWRGIPDQDVAAVVESFDEYRHLSADAWSASARHLKDTGIEFDESRAIEGFMRFAEQRENNAYLIVPAIRSGLVSASEMQDLVKEVESRSYRMLVDPKRGNERLWGFHYNYLEIAALDAMDKLSEADRDVLASRLMASWNSLRSGELAFDQLASALLLTELFDRVGRNPDPEARRDDVLRWLGEHQTTTGSGFESAGGFTSTAGKPHSRDDVTLNAICLMEIYGVPESLDVNQLWSYLRLSALHDRRASVLIAKKVSRDKLSGIADAAPPTWTDYLRSETPLWLAILLVGLAGFATLSSPSLRDLDIR